MNRIKDWLFGLWFFCRTGCTQRWMIRIWRELIEKDVHPANTFRLNGKVPGNAIEVSAYGSQVHVVVYCPNENPKDPELSKRLYEFTINWMRDVGFYVHEKRAKGKQFEMGDWGEIYRQKTRTLRSTQWVSLMRCVAANMDEIEDRSHENMVSG